MGRVTQLYAKSSQRGCKPNNPHTTLHKWYSTPFLLFRGKVNVVWCRADGIYREIGTSLHQFL